MLNTIWGTSWFRCISSGEFWSTLIKSILILVYLIFNVQRIHNSSILCSVVMGFWTPVSMCPILLFQILNTSSVWIISEPIRVIKCKKMIKFTNNNQQTIAIQIRCESFYTAPLHSFWIIYKACQMQRVKMFETIMSLDYYYSRIKIKLGFHQTCAFYVCQTTL